MLDRERSRKAVMRAAMLALLALGANAHGQQSASVKVTGTLVVEDATGAEVADESGSAIVDVREGSVGSWSGKPTKVFVIRGRFELNVPPDARLSFDVFDLDDGKAYWLTEGSAKRRDQARGIEEGIAIPADRKLAIRARYAPKCLLVVTDADSGGPLLAVDVLLDVYHDPRRGIVMRDRHWLGGRQIHPTPWSSSDLRVHNGMSPERLEVETETPFIRWQESFWVHVPGYQWESVDVDFREGGELPVKLKRGGGLTLLVEGEEPPAGARYTLRSAGTPEEVANRGTLSFGGASSVDNKASAADRLAEWWPVSKSRPVRFDGIPPGDYIASVEVGERWNDSIVFAEQRVSIEVGAEAHAALELRGPPDPPAPVPLALELHLDSGWRDAPFEAELVPSRVSPLVKQDVVRIARDSWVIDPQRRGVLIAPEKKVAPGSYRLRIGSFGLERGIRLDSGTAPIVLEIGAPVNVTLHFVDARTRAPVTPTYISWFLADPSGDDGPPSIVGPNLDYPSESFKVRVPAGRIGVLCRLEGYASSKPICIDVEKGVENVVVPMRHLAGVVVRFRIHDHDVPWTDVFHQKHGEGYAAYSVELRATGAPDDEKDPVRSRGSFGCGCYFNVESPGDYRVTFPPIPGFDPIPSRVVKVSSDEFTDVAVDLTYSKE